YTLTIESQFPGYPTLTETVEVGGGNVVRDVQMPADTENCTSAPGYETGSNGMFETLESGALPAGWTVVDHIGNGQVWSFDNPGGRSNLTGGDGGFAIVDSDAFGSGNDQDTELISPIADLTGVADPVIRFNQDFNWFAGGLDEFTDVDLSIDGGATWENVYHAAGADVPGPRVESIAIPQAAGEPDVQVRFHYGNARFEFWWEIDNVLVGELFCVPVDGGLVAGNVLDRNTGDGVNGATVTSVDRPEESTTTFATPDDPGVGDGFYWMFSSLTGRHQFTASAGNYTEQARPVEVEADWTTRRNFQLAAGQLSVTPGAVEADVPLGGSASRTFTVTNTGTATAELELSERDGGFSILRADETSITGQEILASPGAPVQQVPLDAPLAELAGDATVTGAGIGVQTSSPTPAAEPWTDLTSFPQTIFDNNVVEVDGKVYSFGGIVAGAPSTAVFVFDPAAQSWTRLGDMPGASRMQAAEGVIDGKVYLVSGWSDLDTTTMIYDPATDTWATGADAPFGRAAAGSAVLDGQLYVVGGCTTGGCAPEANDVFRYDPASDSWETLADYPAATSWLSCAGVGDGVYCAGGLTASGAPTTTWRYDPGNDAWTPRADMPFNLWGAGYVGANGQFLISGGITGDTTNITNQGLAYNPDSDTWAPLPASNSVLFRPGSACGFYKVGGSDFDPFIGFIPDDHVEVLPGFDTCGVAADVPWLAANPTTATLAPGQAVTVTVSLDGQVAQPGAYTASLAIGEDTPYSVPAVDVTMNVTPPGTWGKITGTVMATSCEGDTAPLAEATVHLSTWVMEMSLFTDDDGGYAHWLDFRHSPFFMIVAKDGYQPQFRQTTVNAGEVTTENWTLKAQCATGTEQPDRHIQ
ncbi:MAG: kelch repeat-containing protein, partial [Natronosporangium sp.]